MTIIETLRKEIKTCRKSRYQISKDTGIDNAALCRIMQGGSCKAETADILCKYFGLELTIRPNKRKSEGHSERELLIMDKKKKSKAELIQRNISTRLNKLKEAGMKIADYNYLWKQTHDLLNEAYKAENVNKKLEEIKKVFEK